MEIYISASTSHVFFKQMIAKGLEGRKIGVRVRSQELEFRRSQSVGVGVLKLIWGFSDLGDLVILRKEPSTTNFYAYFLPRMNSIPSSNDGMAVPMCSIPS